MSAVINGLLGGAIAVILAGAAQRTQRTARLRGDGWHTLRPGWLLHGAFAGSLALSAFIGWILLKGGSTRPDAATQNLYALGLATAFGSGALYMAWLNYGRTIAWQGTTICIKSLFSKEKRISFGDVQKIHHDEAQGEYRITFGGGLKLVLSPYFHGATDLAEQITAFAKPR